MESAHYFRPPDGYEWLELFRFCGGKFVPDDGELDKAFVGKGIPPGSKSGNWFPFGIGSELADVGVREDDHPNCVAYEAAMDHGLKLYGCCNGTYVGRDGKET